MKPYYKIMNFSENSGVKTLFHANNGSKTIPLKEWVWTSKHELVSDGSCNTKYMSGWHVFETLDEAKKYLFKAFQHLHLKVIVKCYCIGDIRPKYHSRANVWLCQGIYLDEIVYLNFFENNP
jgi:hypothetical protein